MKSFESRQSYDRTERNDGEPGIFELSLDAETAGVEQELLGPKRTLAEMLIRNPAFKSEQARRALEKLKKAWEAAEDNVPEELKNELRHERRDAATQDPVHIGSVIADTPARQPGLASMLSTENDEQQTFLEEEENSETAIAPRNASIYRQAMMSGFATALILVIIFMLLLILG